MGMRLHYSNQFPPTTKEFSASMTRPGYPFRRNSKDDGELRSEREVTNMPHCHDMKLGEVYLCSDCGLELKVVKECKEASLPAESCSCTPCSFVCCGQDMVKKET